MSGWRTVLVPTELRDIADARRAGSMEPAEALHRAQVKVGRPFSPQDIRAWGAVVRWAAGQTHWLGLFALIHPTETPCPECPPDRLPEVVTTGDVCSWCSIVRAVA